MGAAEVLPHSSTGPPRDRGFGAASRARPTVDILLPLASCTGGVRSPHVSDLVIVRGRMLPPRERSML